MVSVTCLHVLDHTTNAMFLHVKSQLLCKEVGHALVLRYALTTQQLASHKPTQGRPAPKPRFVQLLALL